MRFISKLSSFLGTLVLSMFFFSQLSFAQLTPLLTATDGATTDSLEHSADDILAEVVRNHQAGNNGLDAFAMGRLRSTDHDGYTVDAVGGSTNFDANEWSVFGAASYSFSGSQTGSRVSITPFIGWTDLDIDLGTAPLAGIVNDAGSATNAAFLYGLAGVYSVGSSYAALSVTGADGETEVRDLINTAPDLSIYKYDTQGIIVSGLVGTTVPVSSFGNGDFFASFSGGLRYIDFEGDRFINTPGTAAISSDISSTTALLSAEIFQVFKAGAQTYRPYLKNVLQIDVDYEHTETFDVFAGVGEVAKASREPLLNKTELGMNVAAENVNLSAAAFGEFADDRTTFGGRLGAKFKLN